MRSAAAELFRRIEATPNTSRTWALGEPLMDAFLSAQVDDAPYKYNSRFTEIFDHAAELRGLPPIELVD